MYGLYNYHSYDTAEYCILIDGYMLDTGLTHGITKGEGAAASLAMWEQEAGS